MSRVNGKFLFTLNPFTAASKKKKKKKNEHKPLRSLLLLSSLIIFHDINSDAN